MHSIQGVDAVRDAIRGLLGDELTEEHERDLLAGITEQHLQASMAALVGGGKTYYFGGTEITLQARLTNPTYQPDTSRVRVDNTSQSWNQLQGSAMMSTANDDGLGASFALGRGAGAENKLRSFFLNLRLRGSGRKQSTMTSGATTHSSLNSKSTDTTIAFRWDVAFTLTARRPGDNPLASRRRARLSWTGR